MDNFVIRVLSNNFVAIWENEVLGGIYTLPKGQEFQCILRPETHRVDWDFLKIVEGTIHKEEIH